MTGVVAGSGRRVAAFFDVDGTLLARPSLEWRFFRTLRSQHAIPAKSYFLWLAQAVQLAPHGIGAIVHANKMYLRGVPVRGGAFSPSSSTGTLAGGNCKLDIADRQIARPQLRAPQAPVPIFFLNAVDQLAWHAAQEHTVVLVTGTLAPLAHELALALLLRLAARGITASIAVCATQLEEAGGRWTGRILGDAMFGEAKARAMWRLAGEAGFDLTRSYAYGDTADDRWMLGAVGRPTAVNPSRELQRIARLLDWPVLWWRNGAGGKGGMPEFRAVAGAKTESLG
jgi:HAD superfamily phosphoserine phosphatase-like hydrolase